MTRPSTTRTLPLLAPLFVVGGVAGLHDWLGPRPGAAALAAAVALCLLGVVAHGRRWRWSRFTALLAAPACAVALGALWTDAALDRRIAARDFAWPAPVVVLEGRVAGLPEARADHVRFDFVPDRLTHRSQRMTVPSGRLRLRWYALEEGASPSRAMPRAGERWRLRVRHRQPGGTVNPVGFDFEGALLRQGVIAPGQVLPHPGNVRIAKARRTSADAARERVVAAIDTALPGQPRAAALLTALTVGDRAGLGDVEWEVLRATGTAHLVAISGMHVAMVAAAVLWLCGLSRRWRRRAALQRYPAPRDRHGEPVPDSPAVSARALARPTLVALGCAALVTTGYAALAGFGLPVQRALVMLLVAGVAYSLGRQVSAFAVLGVAALLAVLVDPLATESAGFWMSYLAVAVLLTAARERERSGEPRDGLRASAWSSISLFTRAQWAVLVGLAPVAWLFIGVHAPLAPLANALAIPVVTLAALPLALLGAVAALLDLAVPATAMFTAAAALLDGLWWALERLPSLMNLDAWEASPPPGARGVLVAALACSGALWLLLARGLASRWFGAVMLLPLALGAHAGISGHGGVAVRLTMLDVGQGQAVLVQSPAAALLYDAGPRTRGGFDAGQAIVLPNLAAMGVEALDLLVVSHADIDHAGGLGAVLGGMPVHTLVLGADTAAPVVVAPALRSTARCDSDQRWQFDTFEVRVVHPGSAAGGTRLSRNDRSCVLELRVGEASVWLAGDIEGHGEAALLASRVDAAARPVPLLVVPHHGAGGSSGEALLDALAPAHGFVSVGARNGYGQPHPEALARYAARGVAVSCTATMGALRADFDASGALLKVTRWRAEHGRRWHQRPQRC